MESPFPQVPLILLIFAVGCVGLLAICLLRSCRRRSRPAGVVPPLRKDASSYKEVLKQESPPQHHRRGRRTSHVELSLGAVNPSNSRDPAPPQPPVCASSHFAPLPPAPPPPNVAGIAPLPDGWEEAHTDVGDVYYYHMGTGKTSWERPRLSQASHALKQLANASEAIATTGNASEVSAGAAYLQTYRDQARRQLAASRPPRMA